MVVLVWVISPTLITMIPESSLLQADADLQRRVQSYLSERLLTFGSSDGEAEQILSLALALLQRRRQGPDADGTSFISAVAEEEPPLALLLTERQNAILAKAKRRTAMRLFVLSAVLPLPCILAREPLFVLMPLVGLYEKKFRLTTKPGQAVVASVEARPCGNQKILGSQLWFRDEGSHRIVSADGMCLARESKNKVYMHKCNEDASQEWHYLESSLTLYYKDRGVVFAGCLELKPPHEITVSSCSDSIHQKFIKEWEKTENWEDIQPTCPYKMIILAVTVVVGAGICVCTICKVCTCSRMTRALTRADPINSLKQPLNDSGNVIIEETLQSLKDTMLNLSSKMTHIAATLDALDAHEQSSSADTVGSWTHVAEEPCCFLPETFLKKVTDVGHEFVSVQNLFQGAQVVAANGTVIEVLSAPEQHQVDAVIKLQAGPSCLVVSPDHRILIPENKTVQARDLEVGSYVVLDGTAAQLTSFEWRLEPTMVLKISFIPDLPVAGFLPQPAIWSKGSRQKPQAGTTVESLPEQAKALLDAMVFLGEVADDAAWALGVVLRRAQHVISPEDGRRWLHLPMLPELLPLRTLVA
eukprot:s1698_g2.t1